MRWVLCWLLAHFAACGIKAREADLLGNVGANICNLQLVSCTFVSLWQLCDVFLALKPETASVLQYASLQVVRHKSRAIGARKRLAARHSLHFKTAALADIP